MAEKVVAYSLEWHAGASVSSAHDILVNSLADRMEVELRAWDGENLREPVPSDSPTMFYMLPPPAKMAAGPGTKIVWIPMWDHARIYSQQWWNELPEGLRIVALSEPVFQRAVAAGLSTLNLRFYLDPAQLPEAQWGEDRVACYWNRTGMLSPDAVERLCRALSLDRLLFRDQLDPRIPDEMAYRLPKTLGATDVVSIRPRSKAEYLEMTRPANLYIAPRAAEGVGLTFLEAMARGCCVLGYDAPTMNEYIHDGKNGLLFKSRFSRLHPAALVRFARRSPHLVNVDQPWKRFSRADLAALGRRAREDHVAGHERWLKSLPAFARFILDW